MKREAQGNDLNGGFKTEYSNKVRLCVILQEDREEKKRTLEGSHLFTQSKSMVTEALMKRGLGQ